MYAYTGKKMLHNFYEKLYDSHLKEVFSYPEFLRFLMACGDALFYSA